MSTDDVFDKGDPKKHYIVLGQIGAGSYGNVYKAQDKKTQEFLALKVLTIEHPDDLEEMTNEVVIHRSLLHPNITAFHGAWRRGKEVSIALELCECGSARDLVARVGFRPVPEAVIAPIARGLLSALQYLHDKWVLHRDVKAANVLITGSGSIKLSDFGVSCRLATRTERRRSLLGTPHWLAPEVMTSVSTFLPYDYKADVWSVGITMVELAEGRPPLWDMDVSHVMAEVPRRPAPLLKDTALYSAAFCDFAHSCLNKSPAARPDVAKLRSHNWIVEVKSGASDLLAYVEKTKQGASAFASTVAAAPPVHLRPSRRALGQTAATASSRGTPPIPPAASASPPPSLSPRPASQQTHPTSASAAPVPTRPMSVQSSPFASPASPPPLSSSPPGVTAAALFALAPPGFSPTFSAPVSPRKITIPASLIAPPSLTDLAVKPVPVASPYSLSNSTSSSASSGPPSLANSGSAVPIPNPPRGSRSPHRTPSPSPPSQTSPLSSPKTSPRHFRNTGVFNPALPSHVHSPQRERAFSGPAPPIAGGQRGLSPQREAPKVSNWKSPPRRAPAMTDAPRPDRSVSPFRAGPGLSPKRERTGTGGPTGGPYIPMFGLQRLSPQRTRPAGLTAPPPLGIPIASVNPNPKTSPGAPPYSAAELQATLSTPVPPLLADLITPHPLSGSTVFQPALNAPPSPRSNYTMMPDMVRSVVPTPMSPRSQRAVPVSTYAPSSPRSNYEYLPDVAAPAPPASSSLLLNLPTSETLAKCVPLHHCRKA